VNTCYINLFKRSDITSINVKDLAHEVGMSVSTIYYQHGSRQEFLRFVASECSKLIVFSALEDFQTFRKKNQDFTREAVIAKGIADFVTEYNKLMPGMIMHLNEEDRKVVQTFLEGFRSSVISWAHELPEEGSGALLWFDILWAQINLAGESPPSWTTSSNAQVGRLVI